MPVQNEVGVGKEGYGWSGVGESPSYKKLLGGANLKNVNKHRTEVLL